MIPRYLYESSRQCERGGLRRWESAMAGAPAGVCTRLGRIWWPTLWALLDGEKALL